MLAKVIQEYLIYTIQRFQWQPKMRIKIKKIVIVHIWKTRRASMINSCFYKDVEDETLSNHRVLGLDTWVVQACVYSV